MQVNQVISCCRDVASCAGMSIGRHASTVALQQVQVSCLGGVREIINQSIEAPVSSCHCMNCLSLSHPLSLLYYNCISSIRELVVATA